MIRFLINLRVQINPGQRISRLSPIRPMHSIMPLRSSFVMPILVATSVSLGWLGSIAEPAPSPSAATTSPATNIRPIIKFAELAYDFGKVDSGTVVKHEYAIPNIGDQTLEITNVQPSCGCTTAGKWDKAVEPGKTGMIPIEFNSTAYGGAVTKTITVTSNDPTNGVVVLQLKGTAWKPINISPGFVMFNLSADIQTNETKVVRIVSNLEDPVTLSAPTWSNNTFQAELKTIKEGKEFELDVTVVPPLTNTVSAPITLKTSSPKMPVITLTAYAMVLPVITVNPPQITLPVGPLPTEAKPSVMIQNNSTNVLALSEPRLTAEGTDIQIKEVQPGHMFTLALSFPAGFQIQPDHPVEASVKSNNPKFPLIKVPVYQMAPRPPAPPQPAPAAQPKAGSSSAGIPPAQTGPSNGQAALATTPTSAQK